MWRCTRLYKNHCLVDTSKSRAHPHKRKHRMISLSETSKVDYHAPSFPDHSIVTVVRQVLCDCRDSRDVMNTRTTGLEIQMDGDIVLIRNNNCGDGAPLHTDPNKDTIPPSSRLHPAPGPSSALSPSITESSKLVVILLVAGLLAIFQRQKVPDKDYTKAAAKDGKKVFMDHTGRDARRLPFVTCLCRELEHHGIPLFVDYKGIEFGTKWAKVIEENARTCQVFVCILSITYFEQYWCMHELDVAFEHDRTILVVINHECERLLKDFNEASFRRMHHRNPMVSEHELDSWCKNIQELRQIQQLWNLHKGKRAEERFLVEVVSAVVGLLERC